MRTCSEALREPGKPAQTEWEVVGLNVAKKLQRMNGNQQLLAETLINKVLMMGLYNELTRSTDIFNPPQPTNYSSGNIHFQSNLSSTSMPGPVYINLASSLDHESNSLSSSISTPLSSPATPTNHIAEFYESVGSDMNSDS